MGLWLARNNLTSISLGYLETWEVNGYLIRKVVKFKENKMCKVNISQVSLKLECSSDHQYVGQIVDTLCNSILHCGCG